MSKKVEKCNVPGCGRPAVHKKAQLCNRCYHWMYYWQGRTPTDIMARKQQLHFWAQRFDFIMPDAVVLKQRRGSGRKKTA